MVSLLFGDTVNVATKVFVSTGRGLLFYISWILKFFQQGKLIQHMSWGVLIGLSR